MHYNLHICVFPPILIAFSKIYHNNVMYKLHWYVHSGPVHMGSQVPSPSHVSKFQCGGILSTFELQETIKIWLIIIKVGSWLFNAKVCMGLVLRVGSSKKLDPTFNTSHEPHLQKVLSCGHPCHTWDSVWCRKFQLPCSHQQLRLHRLTSSDLGLGIPCEPVRRSISWVVTLCYKLPWVKTKPQDL